MKKENIQEKVDNSALYFIHILRVFGKHRSSHIWLGDLKYIWTKMTPPMLQSQHTSMGFISLKYRRNIFNPRDLHSLCESITIYMHSNLGKHGQIPHGVIPKVQSSSGALMFYKFLCFFYHRILHQISYNTFV